MQSLTNQKSNRIANRAIAGGLMLVVFVGCRRQTDVGPDITSPAVPSLNASAPTGNLPIESFDGDLYLLLELLRDRLRLMPAVARYKWEHRSPIEDPERERLLIDRFVTQADGRGLDSNWSRRVITAQIAAARRVQQDCFERWRSAAPDEIKPVLDLQTELRPRIEHITNELIEILARLERHRKSVPFREVFPARTDSLITGESITDEVRHLAVAPWLESEIRADSNQKP